MSALMRRSAMMRRWYKYRAMKAAKATSFTRSDPSVEIRWNDDIAKDKDIRWWTIAAAGAITLTRAPAWCLGWLIGWTIRGLINGFNNGHED